MKTERKGLLIRVFDWLEVVLKGAVDVRSAGMRDAVSEESKRILAHNEFLRAKYPKEYARAEADAHERMLIGIGEVSGEPDYPEFYKQMEKMTETKDGV